MQTYAFKLRENELKIIRIILGTMRNKDIQEKLTSRNGDEWRKCNDIDDYTIGKLINATFFDEVRLANNVKPAGIKIKYDFRINKGKRK